ncbi:hypothetical protein L1049_025287 [Liquidambar formosana]|uniref:Uncharacterized protein n=1 Tax=Liquidambar formosana TaxID=63359 RepID=A0AAP0N737_LIQFO
MNGDGVNAQPLSLDTSLGRRKPTSQKPLAGVSTALTPAGGHQISDLWRGFFLDDLDIDGGLWVSHEIH